MELVAQTTPAALPAPQLHEGEAGDLQIFFPPTRFFSSPRPATVSRTLTPILASRRLENGTPRGTNESKPREPISRRKRISSNSGTKRLKTSNSRGTTATPPRPRRRNSISKR